MINHLLPTIEETLSSTPRSIFQCIVKGFNLSTFEGQINLEIKIGPENPCLTDHQSKTEWLEYMRKYAPCKKYEPEIIQNPSKALWPKYLSEAMNLPFRYASGGALPLVKREDQLYFMMFYRDIFPEGWNIANGSSSDLEDLKNPERIIHREFHEELMVLNTTTNQLLSFKSPKAHRGPEIKLARTLWQNRIGAVPGINQKPLSWIPGPHQVSVKYSNTNEVKTKGYFLSITPEDFSIEFDKIVSFELQKNESLIDGELFKNRLINRLIGLFKIENLTADLKLKTKRFVPEIFFYKGIEYSQKDFKEIFRQSQKDHEWKQNLGSKPLKEELGMCPITESIIKQTIASNLKF